MREFIVERARFFKGSGESVTILASIIKKEQLVLAIQNQEDAEIIYNELQTYQGHS